MSYSFAAHLARFGPEADYPPMDLAQARSYCARLTRTHYENFSVASILLPRRLVPHFHPVYAYCRWADDLGDETGGGQRALDLLAWWRRELLDLYVGEARHPVMIALRPTIERFRIPAQPFLDLLTAFEQDQRVKRYRTFEELLGYCRCSANPVGRLVLYLCESHDETTAAFSDRICTGLQLANFWQDVKRDFADLQRIYIPEEDCQRFGVSEDDLRNSRYTTAFRDLMRCEVDRARQLFEAGQPLLTMIPRDVRADIELFLEGGLAILRKIEAVDFDVLSARPRLSKREKAALVWKALKRKIVSWRQHEEPNPPAPFPKREGGAGFPPPRFGGGVGGGVLPAPDPHSFAWCHRLAKRTAKNFYYSFLVLPRAQRRAMDALYAFMRVTDDLSDEEGEPTLKQSALKKWRADLDRCLQGEYAHPLHPALHWIVEHYGIPPKYLHAVIDGVEMDLQPAPLANFDDLYAYCYRVASAVGLCCIHIWGFRDERAEEYAEAAGIAFQLTNILRDLGEDLERGRVYLPRDELERFGSPPETWKQRGESFQKLMHFQVERAREYYGRAEKLTPFLNSSGRAVFYVMMRIYRGLLEEIERGNYDVLEQRVRLSRWRKLRHLLTAFPLRWGWL